MSSSTLLCHNLIFLNHFTSTTTSHAPSSSFFALQFGHFARPKRFNGVVSRAERNSDSSGSHSSSSSRSNKRKKKKSTWWERFFFEDDGNWLGLKEDDMVETEEKVKKEEDLSGDQKFEAWKQRAEAIIELREAQEDSRNQEYRKWEDWLMDSNNGSNNSSESYDSYSSWSDGFGNMDKKSSDEEEDYDVVKEDEEKGLVESVRAMIFRTVGGGGGGDDDDEDLLYEDHVFNYASTNSAKFLAVLIVIPWAMDFLVHDYVLMPFLDRYVKTVPLAAQLLDVRRYQKLEMIKELKTERGRFELEMEVGKSPPLSEDELWWELRHKALELRDEWRLENRKAFANIWSDAVYGISLFILLYFNKSKVALLKFTGYKIINNISDTGKAFLIILITDIFLGYHSESGWQTLIEVIIEHYGLEVDQAAITVFVCLVPVVVDACVKLWLFKYLPRLSPKVSSIFQEMKRH